jgi:hypothetical protein
MSLKNIVGNGAFAPIKQMLRFLQWVKYNSKMTLCLARFSYFSSDTFLVDKSTNKGLMYWSYEAFLGSFILQNICNENSNVFIWCCMRNAGTDLGWNWMPFHIQLSPFHRKNLPPPLKKKDRGENAIFS